MNHAPPPRRPPAIVRRAPAAAPASVKDDSRPQTTWPTVMLYGVPFALQPDGTYLYSVPENGTETINGQRYTARIMEVLTPVNAPPPPPPPPNVAHISGYASAFGAVTTAAKAGDTLSINGSGFGGLGGNRIGRVMFGSLQGTILNWTDAAITVVVPPVPPGPVTVKVYTQQVPNGWQLAAADGPALVISP